MLNSAINGREAVSQCSVAGVAPGGGGKGREGKGGLVVVVVGGSLVVHFDWSAEFCVERRGRDRLLEANPPGSVRALQQKHLDIPGNICLGKRMNLNKRGDERTK